MVHLKLLTSMVFSLSCLSVALASLKFRTKPAIPIPISKLEVNENFKYLLNVIHNDTKWLIKILLLIKKERNMRTKPRSKLTICEWCLVPDDANRTDQSTHRSNLRRMEKDSHMTYPQIRQILSRMFLDRVRVRRSAMISTLHVPSSRAIHTNEAEKDAEYEDIFDTLEEPEEELSESTPSVKKKPSKRSSTTSTETPSRVPLSTASPTTTFHPTTTSRGTGPETHTLGPGDYRYILRKTDDKGGTVRNCTPAEAMHYCLNDGQCIVVSVIECKLCRCKPGFAGMRCQFYGFLETVETLSNHSDITSVEEIEDSNEQMKVKSTLTATAIYTLNAYRTRNRL